MWIEFSNNIYSLLFYVFFYLTFDVWTSYTLLIMYDVVIRYRTVNRVPVFVFFSSDLK